MSCNEILLLTVFVDCIHTSENPGAGSTSSEQLRPEAAAKEIKGPALSSSTGVDGEAR